MICSEYGSSRLIAHVYMEAIWRKMRHLGAMHERKLWRELAITAIGWSLPLVFVFRSTETWSLSYFFPRRAREITPVKDNKIVIDFSEIPPNLEQSICDKYGTHWVCVFHFYTAQSAQSRRIGWKMLIQCAAGQKSLDNGNAMSLSYIGAIFSTVDGILGCRCRS